MRRILHFIVPVLILFTACEKWDKSADASHIAYLPEFEMIGGEFISYIKDTTKTFKEPGVRARVNGKDVDWYYLTDVDYINLGEPGVYVIEYYAQNNEGFSKTAQRVIAVTYENVQSNDLSGTYIGTLWEPMLSKATKIDDNGLYKMEEVLGYPGASMPGKFVDLGNNKLILLEGEGNFGNYGGSEGSYNSNILTWTVYLLDDPYTGNEIPVYWYKYEE